MNSSNSSIIIHQTLHGYLNGHSLLACSTVLSPLDERRMLLLSDMSGPSMTKGFESYLTGYPLTEKKIFVLSKTWYAPEMGRPGCVWTHSLLINFVDLGRIFHPQILRKYFSRPESLKMTSEYSQNIEVKPFDWQDLHPSMSSLPAKELRATLYSLYQYPKKQIFVPVQDSARRPNYEEMILSIWEYQGVGLRSKFTFCSGSIENRSSSDIAFDLQIIPERNREKIEQRNKGGVFISDKHREIEKYPYWVNYVVDQLIQYELESNLKAYLNACDGDFRDGRSAYTKLLSIYTFFKKDLDFSYRNIEEL